MMLEVEVLIEVVAVIVVDVEVAVSKILYSVSNSSTNEGYLLISHHSQMVSIVSYTDGMVSSLSGSTYPHKVSYIDRKEIMTVMTCIIVIVIINDHHHQQ